MKDFDTSAAKIQSNISFGETRMKMKEIADQDISIDELECLYRQLWTKETYTQKKILKSTELNS